MRDSTSPGQAFAPSRGFARNRAIALLAVLVMILAGAVVILFARPAAESGAIETEARAPDTGGSFGFQTTRRASPDEVRAYLNDMFDRLDRDGSGHVDAAEAPRHQVTSFRARDGTIGQLPLTQAEWIDQGDADRDGRVSRTEYFAHLIPPVQAILGVPEDWSPRDGQASVRAPLKRPDAR